METTIDKTALYRIRYGLYVITVRDGGRDTGCVVNSVCQLTSSPCRIAVTVNKANYTHDVIASTRALNLNCIERTAPFALFQQFGFQSGRDADKFGSMQRWRMKNGIAALTEHINAVMSLSVTDAVDMGTHTMFVCELTEAHVISDEKTMSYDYYQSDVKPKPQPKPEQKRGFVCKICGYIHEGDELPEDFVCPICKHGADDFERL